MLTYARIAHFYQLLEKYRCSPCCAPISRLAVGARWAVGAPAWLSATALQVGAVPWLAGSASLRRPGAARVFSAAAATAAASSSAKRRLCRATMQQHHF
jgi:hypothetical protein